MESSKEQHLFEIVIYNITNDITVIVDQFNASLLNESINFSYIQYLLVR